VETTAGSLLITITLTSNMPIVESGGAAGASVPDASTTVKGIVELADSSEVDGGSDASRAITPDALAGSNLGARLIQVSALPAGAPAQTGDSLARFVIPGEMAGYDLVSVAAGVDTAGTTGTIDIQVRNVSQAADMLSTVMTIDSGENSTATAATPAVIDTANDDVAGGDLIAIDIDAVQTTPSKGLIVILGFKLP